MIEFKSSYSETSDDDTVKFSMSISKASLETLRDNHGLDGMIALGEVMARAFVDEAKVGLSKPADHRARLLDATLEVPMRPIESSNIAAIGHAAGVTQIEFKGGGAYRYRDEGGSNHMRLADAKSVGKTFHQFRGAMQAQGCAKLNGAVWTLLGK